jgi:hypothetical protein
MKKVLKYFCLFMAIDFMAGACKKNFLNVTPQASLSPQLLTNKAGLDALLIAAYSNLDGITTGITFPGWTNAFDNWLYGEVAADNALKGSEITDQNDMNPIEEWGPLVSTNSYMDPVWVAVYEGVARSNSVLRILAETKGLDPAVQKRIQGEAKFLRAHYFHLGKRYFNMLPYIDETVTNFSVPNDKDIWPNIIKDYQDAISLLPVDPYQIGRAHLNAAKAGLATAYLDQGQYALAKPLLDDIINSGRYILFPNFFDNFNPTLKTLTTQTEAIFQIQSSLTAAGTPYNGNFGDLTNGIAVLHGCCGFYQPSQNLVNAYKTDLNGLPMLDTFNNTDLKSDDGIKSSDPFTPPADNLDPRLDFTVGRRGIPFLDWGLFPGSSWIVNPVTYGPYRAKKFLATKAQLQATNGGFLGGSIINHSIPRYADILLMRAECAVEANDLTTALTLVNQIRSRAKTSPPVALPNGNPAANYLIQLYTSFPDQDYARKAVRFERRLELALEGNRWYDLVRWGVSKAVITAYFASEGRKRILLKQYGQYKSDYLPIPSNEISISKDKNGKPTLTQNPGY